MRTFDASTVSSVPYPVAADAIIAALADGFDPAGDPPRSSTPTSAGAFLLMPSEVGDVAGIKVLTHAPGNADRGAPTIQGHYLLFDAETMSPLATLDGAGLTTLRTPALSIAAARPFLTALRERLAAAGERPTVAIFGAGPQGLGHADALRAELGELEAVTFIVRRPEAVDPAAREAGSVVEAGSAEAQSAVGSAHIVVCATGAREALFDAADVREDVLVLALGSHLPEAREVPAELMGRATVVVEDRGAALREAGDVIRAIADGALDESSLITMRDLHGPSDDGLGGGDPGGPAPAPRSRDIVARADGKPVVVKTVGMGWQDLAVAREILSR